MQFLECADSVYTHLFNGKKVTIRKGARQITTGLLSMIHVNDGRTQLVIVTDVIVTPLMHVTKEDYMNDGFSNTQELLEGMRTYYPDIVLDSLVTVVRFKLAASREQVYDAINTERDYQNNQRVLKYNDKVEDVNKSISDFVVYMETHLQRAKDALYFLNPDKALNEIRKVTALGVATMENHGAPKRKENDYEK